MLTIVLEVLEVRKVDEGVEMLLGRPSGAVMQEYPSPQSEEEEMAFAVMRAFEKYLRLPIPQRQAYTFMMRLSDEEYSILGKPTVGDLIEIKMERRQEG
ncbi:MAG: hypothetical protein ACP5KE_07660 [Candidatus Methanodesulfokora sp.]